MGKIVYDNVNFGGFVGEGMLKMDSKKCKINGTDGKLTCYIWSAAALFLF